MTARTAASPTLTSSRPASRRCAVAVGRKSHSVCFACGQQLRSLQVAARSVQLAACRLQLALALAVCSLQLAARSLQLTAGCRAARSLRFAFPKNSHTHTSPQVTFRLSVPLNQYSLGAPRLRGFKVRRRPGARKRVCLVLGASAAGIALPHAPCNGCSRQSLHTQHTPNQATGFAGGNLPKSGPGKVDAAQLEDCDILGNCDDLEAEAAIR